jgi:uncharacterized protein (TIGR04255 family)
LKEREFKLTKYPVLRNAPIIEAIIDIRVKISSDFDVTRIDGIYRKISSEYPERQQLRLIESRFDEGSVTVSAPKLRGYRYSSSDKKQILQARIDGFTFSRLKPYIMWENIRDEARKLWKLYRDITSPEAITRVAVRYINNLNIPMPIKDFGEYLTAPPIVPEPLPQGITSFLNRVVIHEPSLDAHAIITQALEQVAGDVAPVILDIDVFILRPEGIEENKAWETLEKLRDFKNEIFFSSITDKLKEMFR